MAITKARRDRMAEALNLRQRGISYTEIGRRLGVSHATAYDDVQDALREITREPAESVLAIELGRLDAILTPMVDAAVAGDQGAADRVLRIMDRRAKYLGLDNAPRNEGAEQVATLLEQLLTQAPDGTEREAAPVNP